jgi:rhodanese-related sulfurtransferase
MRCFTVKVIFMKRFVMRKVMVTFFLVAIALSLNAQVLKEDYLGIGGEEDISFIVGENDDMVVMRRVMRPCGINRGYLQPLSPAKGVTTITEMDMLHALNDKQGIVVDMRLEAHYLESTIPSSVNFPYIDVADHLDAFGCIKKKPKAWDCTEAKNIYAFCNGPACTQSPTGIRAMIGHGFPANKIFYYRGGMLVWYSIGLPVVEGDF